ncbi:MAG: hypothetical protein M3270_10360 [Thermoproteota archaeon]|nr:hypothetical protein [Thermoproteota archaeon]
MFEQRQGLTQDARFAAYENSIERQKSILSKQKHLSDTVKQLRENYIKERDKILGSRRKEDYLKLRQKLREQELEIETQYLPTPEGEKIRSQFRKMRSAKMHDFVSTLGGDYEAVRNVQKMYGAQINSAVKEVMKETRGPVADTKAPPLEGDPNNPWVYLYPPYIDAAGFQMISVLHGDQVDAEYSTMSHFESALTGEIGCKHLLDMRTFEEDDHLEISVRSELWFSYRMPASVSGLIEVVAFLQCIDTPFQGHIDDDSGFSYAELEASSSIYLEQVPPVVQPPPPPTEPRYATVLYIQKTSDGDDKSWSGEVRSPGQFLYPHFYSMNPYAAGHIVTLKLGVEDWQSGKVDDMDIYSSITNRWFVSKIAVRASPTP